MTAKFRCGAQQKRNSPRFLIEAAPGQSDVYNCLKNGGVLVRLGGCSVPAVPCGQGEVNGGVGLSVTLMTCGNGLSDPLLIDVGAADLLGVAPAWRMHASERW